MSSKALYDIPIRVHSSTLKQQRLPVLRTPRKNFVTGILLDVSYRVVSPEDGNGAFVAIAVPATGVLFDFTLSLPACEQPSIEGACSVVAGRNSTASRRRRSSPRRVIGEYRRQTRPLINLE